MLEEHNIRLELASFSMTKISRCHSSFYFKDLTKPKQKKPPKNNKKENLNPPETIMDVFNFKKSHINEKQRSHNGLTIWKKTKVNKNVIKILWIVQVFKNSISFKDILFSKLHNFSINKSIWKISTSSILKQIWKSYLHSKNEETELKKITVDLTRNSSEL